MLASFFVPGGAAMSGWTSYAPLADFAPTGQTWWLFGMLLIIFSSLLGTCSQLCGLAHFRMKGVYKIQSQGDYDAWLKEEATYLDQR